MNKNIQQQDLKFLNQSYSLLDIKDDDKIHLWIYNNEQDKDLIYHTDVLDPIYYNIDQVKSTINIDYYQLCKGLNLITNKAYYIQFVIIRNNKSIGLKQLSTLQVSGSQCSIVYVSLDSVSNINISLQTMQPVLLYNNTFNRIVNYKKQNNYIILKLYGQHTLQQKHKVNLAYLLTDIVGSQFYYQRIKDDQIIQQYIELLPNYTKYIEDNRYIQNIVKQYTLQSFSNKIRSYIASNIQNTKIYSRITDLKDIFHYSSLQFRLNIFITKIKTLQQLNLKNDIYYINRANQITKSFDILEYNMYHIPNFKYSVPTKLNRQLVDINSQQFNIWYDNTLRQFRLLDENNLNTLYKLFPKFLQNDQQFYKFINLIGWFIDCQIWMRINSLSLLYNIDQREYSYINKDNTQFIENILKLNGVTKESSLLQFLFNSDYILGKQSSLTNKERRQIIIKRIYNNLPYILKSKGTVQSIYYIANCFGVPRQIINIKEFSNSKDIKVDTYIRDKYLLLLDGSAQFKNTELKNKSLYFNTTLNKNNSFRIELQQQLIFQIKNINNRLEITDISLDEDYVFDELNKQLNIFLVVNDTQLNLLIHNVGFTNILNLTSQTNIQFINDFKLIINNEYIKNIKMYSKQLRDVQIFAQCQFSDSLYTYDNNQILNYYSLSEPSNSQFILNQFVTNDYVLQIKYNQINSTYPYNYIKNKVQYNIRKLPFIQELFPTNNKIRLLSLDETENLYVDKKININQQIINNKIEIQFSPINILNDFILSIYGSLQFNNMSLIQMQKNIAQSVFTKFRYRVKLNQFNRYISQYNNTFFKMIQQFIPASCISFLGYTIKNSILYKNVIQTNKMFGKALDYKFQSYKLERYIDPIRIDYHSIFNNGLNDIVSELIIDNKVVIPLNYNKQYKTNIMQFYQSVLEQSNLILNKQVINTIDTSYNGQPVVQIDYINKDSIKINDRR